MPYERSRNGINIVNGDIKLNIFGPIIVQNNMTDLSMMGDGRVRFSNPQNLNFEGALQLTDKNSKFILKGHEFLLSKGKITVEDPNTQIPQVDFIGMAHINDYDITAKIHGPANNITLALSSSPPLSQSNILSLITLGVIDSGQDQEAIIASGIGSLLIEHLGVTDKLNNDLGITLDVTPGGHNIQAPLQERQAHIDQTDVPAFTKIRISKKIKEGVNLSLSNNVGNTIRDNQEVAIDIELIENLLFKGVYELTSPYGIESTDENSFGIDLIKKFRF